MAKEKPIVKKELKSNQFEFNGKQYEVIMGKVNIPLLGVLTANEIAVEPAAQEYLIVNNCLGSIIKEIF